MNYNNLSGNWKKLFSNPAHRNIFLVTTILLIVVLNLFGKFLIFVEARRGVVLPDPFLQSFAARDFNALIFIIIYTSLLTGLSALILTPRNLIIALQTYILMVMFRFIAMIVTPLEVPEGTIDLRDPLVFTIGTGHFLTKDLFFSGHVASLTILFLTAVNKYLKYVFLALTVILTMLILMQKTHYTIDLYVAPFFSFTAYSIAKKIDAKVFKDISKENILETIVSKP